MASPIGTPAPSHNKLRLTPSLARSVGFGPVFFPAQRRLRHRAIHRLPGPVNALHLVILVQPVRPELLKDSGLAPLLKSQMGRGTAANPGRVQRVPLTAGTQDEHNAIHGLPVWNRGTAPNRRISCRTFWQQRLDPFPHRIGELPPPRRRVRSFHTPLLSSWDAQCPRRIQKQDVLG